jgi:hypothetical protein
VPFFLLVVVALAWLVETVLAVRYLRTTVSHGATASCGRSGTRWPSPAVCTDCCAGGRIPRARLVSHSRSPVERRLTLQARLWSEGWADPHTGKGNDLTEIPWVRGEPAELGLSPSAG